MAGTVVIAGAGIGGLVSALALQKAGIEARVYEQADAIGDVGAGISLGVSACLGLYSLGLEPRIREMADEPHTTSTRHYRTGEPLYPPATKAAPNPGALLMIHRADLYAILSEAVAANDPETITLGRKLVGFEQDEGGVTARFADGGEARGDVLIGADGLRSTVRTLMFGEETPRFTGQVVYRFLIPADDVREHLSAGDGALFIGPGMTMLRYLIRHRSLVNGVAFVRTDAWTGEGWGDPATPEEMLEIFAGWHPDILAIMAKAPLSGTAKWALYDRDPLPTWVDRRVALLGDSAHPMLPFLGLGAAMGIEDGVVLGRALAAGGDFVAGLKRYEAMRLPRANGILLASRAEGEIFQTVDPEKLSATRRPSKMPGVYDYDPVTVPLPG